MSAETETDVDVLLECLRCQAKDFAGMKRSLIALAYAFKSDDDSKEYFRRVGGLQTVQKLLFTELPSATLQAALFCLSCAVENDVFCQNVLTKKDIFSFLHVVLTEKRSEERCVHAAVFLLVNLVAGNSTAQRLANDTSLLADLLSLFRECSEKCRAIAASCQQELDLWSAVVTALSMCVNNPRNETNQRKCSTLLPLCFQVVVEDKWRSFTMSMLSFINLTVAGNGYNQNRVRQCGLLDTLLKSLRQTEEKAQEDVTQSLTAVGIISVIDACITDNKDNAGHFMRGGGVGTIMRLVGQQRVTLTSHSLLQLLLALGHAVEYADCCSTPLTTGDQHTLVQLLTETEDEELVHAIKYVLNTWQKKAEAEQILQTADREVTQSTQRIKHLSAQLSSTGCTLPTMSYATPASEEDARVPVYRRPPSGPRPSLRSPDDPAPQPPVNMNQARGQHQSSFKDTFCFNQTEVGMQQNCLEEPVRLNQAEVELHQNYLNEPVRSLQEPAHFNQAKVGQHQNYSKEPDYLNQADEGMPQNYLKETAGFDQASRGENQNYSPESAGLNEGSGQAFPYCPPLPSQALPRTTSSVQSPGFVPYLSSASAQGQTQQSLLHVSTSAMPGHASAFVPYVTSESTFRQQQSLPYLSSSAVAGKATGFVPYVPPASVTRHQQPVPHIPQTGFVPTLSSATIQSQHQSHPHIPPSGFVAALSLAPIQSQQQSVPPVPPLGFGPAMSSAMIQSQQRSGPHIPSSAVSGFVPLLSSASTAARGQPFPSDAALYQQQQQHLPYSPGPIPALEGQPCKGQAQGANDAVLYQQQQQQQQQRLSYSPVPVPAMAGQPCTGQVQGPKEAALYQQQQRLPYSPAAVPAATCPPPQPPWPGGGVALPSSTVIGNPVYPASRNNPLGLAGGPSVPVAFPHQYHDGMPSQQYVRSSACEGNNPIGPTSAAGRVTAQEVFPQQYHDGMPPQQCVRSTAREGNNHVYPASGNNPIGQATAVSRPSASEAFPQQYHDGTSPQQHVRFSTYERNNLIRPASPARRLPEPETFRRQYHDSISPQQRHVRSSSCEGAPFSQHLLNYGRLPSPPLPLVHPTPFEQQYTQEAMSGRLLQRQPSQRQVSPAHNTFSPAQRLRGGSMPSHLVRVQSSLESSPRAQEYFHPIRDRASVPSPQQARDSFLPIGDRSSVPSLSESLGKEERREHTAFQYFKKFLSSFGAFVGKDKTDTGSVRSQEGAEETVVNMDRSTARAATPEAWMEETAGRYSRYAIGDQEMALSTSTSNLDNRRYATAPAPQEVSVLPNRVEGQERKHASHHSLSCPDQSNLASKDVSVERGKCKLCDSHRAALTCSHGVTTPTSDEDVRPPASSIRHQAILQESMGGGLAQPELTLKLKEKLKKLQPAAWYNNSAGVATVALDDDDDDDDADTDRDDKNRLARDSHAPHHVSSDLSHQDPMEAGSSETSCGRKRRSCQAAHTARDSDEAEPEPGFRLRSLPKGNTSSRPSVIVGSSCKQSEDMDRQEEGGTLQKKNTEQLNIFKVPMPRQQQQQVTKATTRSVEDTEGLSAAESGVIAWSPMPCGQTPTRRGLRRAPSRTPTPLLVQGPCGRTAHGSALSQSIDLTTPEQAMTAPSPRTRSVNRRSALPQSIATTERAMTTPSPRTKSVNRRSVLAQSIATPERSLTTPSPRNCPSKRFDARDLSSATIRLIRCDSTPVQTLHPSSTPKSHQTLSSLPLGAAFSHPPLPPPSPAASEFDLTLLRAATGSVCVLKRKTKNDAPPSFRDAAPRMEEAFIGTPLLGRAERWTPLSNTSMLCRAATLRRAQEEREERVPTSSASEDEEVGNASFSHLADGDGDSQSLSGSSSCPSEVYHNVDSILQQPGTQKVDNKAMCPGCGPTQVLNSRNFNIAIETGAGTCRVHRQIRQIERDYILQQASKRKQAKKLSYQIWKENLKVKSVSSDEKVGQGHTGIDKVNKMGQGHKGNDMVGQASKSAYDFGSSSSDKEPHRVSPPRSTTTPTAPRPIVARARGSAAQRRRRVPYSDQEVCQLARGVRQMGRSWAQILLTFPFHPSRNAVDLKDKYRQMQKTAAGRKRSVCKTSLSMCEERRLRRGVRRLGHNWAAILRCGTFAQGRTAEQLRDRWRVMAKGQPEEQDEECERLADLS